MKTKKSASTLKTPKKIDFFTQYRFQKIRTTLLSVTFALVLSISIITLWKNPGSFQGLLADMQTVTRGETYDTDLVIKQNNTDFTIVFGANAKKVHHLSFFFTSDPTYLTALTSDDPKLQILTTETPGKYQIIANLSDIDLFPGNTISAFHATTHPKAPIALTDIFFESDGEKYNITGKIQ